MAASEQKIIECGTDDFRAQAVLYTSMLVQAYQAANVHVQVSDVRAAVERNNNDGSVDILVAMRVKPYYLHHADLARGTAHFRTGIAAGQRLVRSLRGHISGLCQPTYVLDIPGGYGKVPIAPCAASARTEAREWSVEDGDGVQHAYPADPQG